MKRILSLLLIAGAFSFATPSWGEDVAPATISDTQSEVVAPAATTAAPAPAAEVVEVKVETAAPAPAPEAPAATEAAPQEPQVNTADNGFIMICAALVILMSIPGIALFYGGLVRSKNMLSVLAQTIVIFSLMFVLWAIYGYSLAFGADRKSVV